jgi:predicted nucleotidyltransferase
MSFPFNGSVTRDELDNLNRMVQKMAKTSSWLQDSQNPIFAEIRTNLSLLSSNLDDMEVHFFGSRVIGVGSNSSDLDIFIDCGWKFKAGYKFTLDDREVFDTIGHVLRTSSRWRHESTILKTTVPILTLEFLPLGVKCKQK